MIASICTSLFSLSGEFLIALESKSIVDDAERRVTRTATLDGGAVVYDAGYSDADRTFTLLTKDTIAALSIRDAARTHSGFTVSIKSGLFHCVFEKVQFTDDEAKLTFLAV